MNGRRWLGWDWFYIAATDRGTCVRRRVRNMDLGDGFQDETAEKRTHRSTRGPQAHHRGEPPVGGPFFVLQAQEGADAGNRTENRTADGQIRRK